MQILTRNNCSKRLINYISQPLKFILNKVRKINNKENFNLITTNETDK